MTSPSPCVFALEPFDGRRKTLRRKTMMFQNGQVSLGDMFTASTGALRKVYVVEALVSQTAIPPHVRLVAEGAERGNGDADVGLGIARPPFLAPGRSQAGLTQAGYSPARRLPRRGRIRNGTLRRLPIFTRKCHRACENAIALAKLPSLLRNCHRSWRNCPRSCEIALALAKLPSLLRNCPRSCEIALALAKLPSLLRN